MEGGCTCPLPHKAHVEAKISLTINIPTDFHTLNSDNLCTVHVFLSFVLVERHSGRIVHFAIKV